MGTNYGWCVNIRNTSFPTVRLVSNLTVQLMKRVPITVVQTVVTKAWTEYVNNEVVFGKMRRKMSLVLRIGKKEFKFLGYMSKKSLENLTHTQSILKVKMTEGNSD